MPICAMKFCKYSSNKNHEESEITFHKFPTDLFWKEKWIELVRKCRTEDNWLPSETSVVCSKHFADIDWYITTRSKNQRKNQKMVHLMVSDHCRTVEVIGTICYLHTTRLIPTYLEFLDNIIDAETVPSTSDDNSLIFKSANPNPPSRTRYAGDRPCMVCNVKDNKSRRGYNYGAFTCRSCMYFFRRCELGDSKQTFLCQKNESCDLSQYISYRKWCQFCRYKKCLAVGMVPYCKEEAMDMFTSPLTHDVDPDESAATNPVKSKPLTSGDGCIGAIPNGNILEDREAEDVILPSECPLVAHLQYESEQASDDYIAVKNEVPDINYMDTSTEKDNETVSLQNEECSSDDISLSTFKFESPILGDNNEKSSEPSMKNELPRLCDIVFNNPIVYTTRLDDMRTLNNIHCNFDEKNLYEKIIIESKPTLKSYNNNHSRKHYESEISFKNLVENINMINMKWKQGLKHEHKDHDPIKPLNSIDISVNLSERSRNLLIKCKTVSIPVENLKNKYIKKVSKAKQKSKGGRSITNESLHILNVMSSWHNISQNTKTIFIILNNFNTNIIEMYLIDRLGIVRQYYRNTVSKSDMYQCGVQNQNFYKLNANVCCWHKREAELKSLCSKLNVNMPRFMKARHDCEGPHCACCCKPYKSIDCRDDTSLLIIDDQLELRPKNIIQSLYTMHDKSEPLLINSAITYIPRIRTKTSSKQTVLTKIRYNAIILLKHNRTSEYDYYELGANGEVVKYIKYNKQEGNSHKTLTNLKPITYCCWFERENILRKLPSMNVSPNTLTFMKTPHGCPLMDCCCCCKIIRYKEEKRRPILKMNIPISPIYTSNNNKSTLVKIEFNKKSPILNIKTLKHVTKTNSSHIVDLTGMDSYDPKTILSNTTKNDHQTNKYSPKSYRRTKMRTKEVSSLKCNIIDQKLNVRSLDSNKADRKSNSNSSDPNRTESTINSPEIELKRFTDSMFEKYSNVTLEINNEGKVAAKVVSGSKLSNADLKTLGCIVSLAQKEIDVLKLAPRTNINKPNIATYDTTTVPTNINKVRPISNDLNEELSTIILHDVANKTIHMSKKSNCHLSDVDKIYGNFSSLYYANRIHSQAAFFQIKKDLIIADTFVKKTPNKRLLNVANKNNLSSLNSTNELGSVNKLLDSLTDKMAGEINPQILNNTQSLNTTKFHDQRTLGKPGPFQGVFTNFLLSPKNKEDERVDVFTHKTIKRNLNMADQNDLNMADQNGNKRPRVGTTQLNALNNMNNQHISNNAATYQPIIISKESFTLACNNGDIDSYNQFLPSTAEVCNQTLDMATPVDFPKTKIISGKTSDVSKKFIVSPFAHIGNNNAIGVIPSPPPPAQVPHVNLVFENIFCNGVPPNLQPLSLTSPQTPVVKMEHPTLAGLPLSYPLCGEADGKQDDDCILGI